MLLLLYVNIINLQKENKLYIMHLFQSMVRIGAERFTGVLRRVYS